MSKKSLSIKSTGDLRNFLAQTLDEMKNGNIGRADAIAVAHIASVINKSFASEAAMLRVKFSSGENAPALGAMPISNTDAQVSGV